MTVPTFLTPDWPAPPGVNAAVTTRIGGLGKGAFASLNLAFHVGDDERTVESNRVIVQQQLGLPAQPNWLTQVHGTDCVEIEDNKAVARQGDAAWTRENDTVLAVMVADCLPMLLASRDGAEIAVVHAGWKGLAAGVIQVACRRFHHRDVIAWMGPAIGPCHYEVDTRVKDAFGDTAGFAPGKDKAHWMLDLYAAARKCLTEEGITGIYGGGFCTYCDPEQFFSYRRDGETGRMAALIWKSNAY